MSKTNAMKPTLETLAASKAALAEHLAQRKAAGVPADSEARFRAAPPIPVWALEGARELNELEAPTQ